MMWQGLAGWGRRGGVWALMAAAAFWLSGCASTVTTEVTSFRQTGWSNDAPRTYAFDHAPQQDVQLDRQTYEAWLAQALAGVGFEQAPARQARYLVSM